MTTAHSGLSFFSHAPTFFSAHAAVCPLSLPYSPPRHLLQPSSSMCFFTVASGIAMSGGRSLGA